MLGVVLGIRNSTYRAGARCDGINAGADGRGDGLQVGRDARDVCNTARELGDEGVDLGVRGGRTDSGDDDGRETHGGMEWLVIDEGGVWIDLRLNEGSIGLEQSRGSLGKAAKGNTYTVDDVIGPDFCNKQTGSGRPLRAPPHHSSYVPTPFHHPLLAGTAT